jgi:hypothetical protein
MLGSRYAVLPFGSITATGQPITMALAPAIIVPVWGRLPLVDPDLSSG